jgi:hypothetical protein
VICAETAAPFKNKNVKINNILTNKAAFLILFLKNLSKFEE